VAHEVVERFEEIGDWLFEHATEAEDLGRLPDETAKKMRWAGVIRMLQPKEWGGYEAHPCDFFEAVMTAGHYCGATGWVGGIVGVHPWELALCDPKIQQEVWGEDPDVWMASPYAPLGQGRPVEGGFIFNGKWSFSSGTDHCDWIVLGGFVVDDSGALTDPPQMLHFMLPRSDYEIVEDSWNVVGLKGTGSKDIIVRDAFIPTYRTIDAAKVLDGRAAKEAGRTETLFKMPWSAVFPNAITAAVIGIAEGALACHVAYQRDRVNVLGAKIIEDPYLMEVVGEAASEIDACRAQMLTNVARMYDIVDAGGEVPYEMRAGGRRDQVRGSFRAMAAVDRIFSASGGNALRMDKPLQRFWRDGHAGLNHAVNVTGPIYNAYAAATMGLEPTGMLRLTI
jgi:3-hydroxy-9,10-secoandrosta-1,3,5(10)-triene-9,17-dione monooxygenase